MDSTSLVKMTETQMINRINSARFPQEMKPEDKKLLALVAISYGFDPLMGEITIYQGRPFVSIDGRYRKAQETGNLIGVRTRPANKQEREDWGIPEGDIFFKAEVSVKGGGLNVFEGWGRVRAAETKPGSSRQGDTTSTFKPIQANPQRMAEKRAEAMALRKAFHIPLPSLEEKETEAQDGDYQVVDTGTGEIIDAPPTEDEKTQATKDAAELFGDNPAHVKQASAPAAVPAKNSPVRDPKTVDTMQKFWAAAYVDWKIMKAEVMTKLGYSSINDFSTPDVDYAKLQLVMGENK